MSAFNYRRPVGVTENLLDSLREPSLPVDVVAMARRLGASVHTDSGESDLTGALAERGGRLRITVQPQDGPRHFDGFTSRQRFTIAHEIAHVLLTRWSQSICLRSGSVERACEEIASEILMPSELVFDRAVGVRSGDELLVAVEQLSRDACVSTRAAAIAVVRLLPGYTVQRKAGWGTWSVSSRRPDEVLSLDRFREAVARPRSSSKGGRSQMRLHDGSHLVAI